MINMNSATSIEIAIDWFEANHIMVQTSTINELFNKWHKRFPHASNIQLAALIIANPYYPYSSSLDYKEINNMVNFYFN